MGPDIKPLTAAVGNLLTVLKEILETVKRIERLLIEKFKEGKS